MINSQQNPGPPNDDAASAVTMDDVVSALVATAASGIPAAWDTDDLAALGLMEDDPVSGRIAGQNLDALASTYGCSLSGPYLGHDEGLEAYYLFERRKPG